MGSILQQRAAPRSVEPGFIGCRRRASGSSGRTGVGGRTKIGRRQQQRRSPQPQSPTQSEENQEQKASRRKRRSRSNPSCSRHGAAQHRQTSHPDGGGPKVKASSVERGVHRECIPPRPPCSPDQPDSDTDLSELERLSPTVGAPGPPPPLELRPEIMEEDQTDLRRQRGRGRRRAGPDFPDFLPPPFNSWSLGQLAVFYNTEGRGALGPRPAGPLERYLERLLQLEWYQIQTVQSEREVGGVTAVCQRAPSRLSSPKCILHCPRAFPLPFLSGSACALCPAPDRSRGPPPRSKRSYSESRVRSGSPTRTSSYLRRMQASGNIRHPIGTAARTGSDPTAAGS